MFPMNKLLPKLLTTLSLVLFLGAQLPTKAFSDTTARSTPTSSSSKKPLKKSSKKTAKSSSSKKSSKSSVKKKQAKTAPAPQAEAVIPPQPQEASGPALPQQVTAYKYAYELYSAQQFEKAKDIFKKLAMVTTHHGLHANSLYYYSQCAFRTEDYLGCVKALKILAAKEPGSAAIRKGYVSRFCIFLIDQAASLQTNWDYFRYQAKNADDNGNPVWMESIPPGPKIKRINFRLAFGLYRVLHTIQPNSAEDTAAKQKLENMLEAPLTITWVDEKAATSIYGHPGDFFSVFSTREKKHFSKVICERMFFDFETEYFYKFLDMHDDVRNLRPRFVATSRKVTSSEPGTSTSMPPVPQSIEENPAVPPPPGSEASSAPAAANSISVTTALSTDEDPNKPLTLGNLLHVAGYYPWLDSYSSTIETELSL
jgi:hypothetical protein